jgi:hypothetical protein
MTQLRKIWVLGSSVLSIFLTMAANYPSKRSSSFVWQYVGPQGSVSGYNNPGNYSKSPIPCGGSGALCAISANANVVDQPTGIGAPFGTNISNSLTIPTGVVSGYGGQQVPYWSKGN